MPKYKVTIKNDANRYGSDENFCIQLRDDVANVTETIHLKVNINLTIISHLLQHQDNLYSVYEPRNAHWISLGNLENHPRYHAIMDGLMLEFLKQMQITHHNWKYSNNKSFSENVVLSFKGLKSCATIELELDSR